MMERISHRTLSYRPKRFWRAALAASTCLSAVTIAPLAARAQSLPSSTTPTGGSVTAGSAAISQSPGQTVINQASQNAAINWQTFNVGSAAKVQFNQPNVNATTLNRVIAQSPSVIAGQIDANGNIIIVNQSGVVFAKGSEVDAHGVIATTSNITDGDFMNGHLAFTGTPKPGAKIINDGHITVHDTGLVGLIAPQVANNGVITARLGQVVLAGATAFTLDLYGDRLISLDVTKAVRAVDVGGKPVAALVTNSGLILADGGKITLTAQDADALVTQLINAGGTIRANTVGSKTGSISITGVGGNINIAGSLLVQGKGTASVGGGVELVTDGTVNVASTARIDASGAAGGGVVALGTDLARATQGAADTAAPRAATVKVAAGALINASATSKGDAGTVTLLSADDTAFAGTIAVTGGPQGGHGGLAEISSDDVISLGGTVFDTAINGQAGEVLLDPATLVVTTGGSVPVAGTVAGSNGTTTIGTDNSTTSYIDPSVIDSLGGGKVVLTATSLLSIASAIDMAGAGSALSLASGAAVSITAGITVLGSLEIDAGTTLALTGAGLTATNILLDGSSGIGIGAPVSTTGDLAIESTGAVTEGSGGALRGGTLVSVGTVGGAALFTQPNSLAALGSVNDASTFALTNPGSLTLIGSLAAPDIYLAAGTLSDAGSPVSIIAGATSAAGILALSADRLDFGTGSTLAAPGGTIEIGPSSAAVIDIGASASTGTLGLPTSLTTLFGGTDTHLLIGTASLGTLASGAAATIALDGAANFHTAALTLSATSLVADNAGTLTAGQVTLATGSFAQSTSAAIDTTLLASTVTLAGLSALGTNNAVGTLGNVNVSATGTLAFTDTGLLTTGILNAGAATLSAPTLAVGGALDIAGALTLAGLTGGATQTAPITAGTLAGQGVLAGGITFANTLNSITNLGDLALTGTGALDVTDAGTLNLPGTILAPGGLSLAAGTLITQPGSGAITAAATNELALLLAPTLSLAGTISAPASGAEIALEANTVALTGTLTAGQGAVAIAPYSGDTTIVVGGAMATGTLDLDPTALGSITADALLLGSIDGVAATNTAMLIISAPLTTASELGLFSSASTGAVLETGTGSLRAPSLVGATGMLTLANSNNFLDAIGAAPLPLAGTTLTGGFSVASSLTVAENVDLTIGGSVTAGTLVALTAAALTVNGTVTAPTVSLAATSGNMMLNGFVSAVSALVLASSGDITESGSLTAGTLDAGSLGGAFSLSGTNTITDLGAVSLSAGHALTLDDSVSLTLTGSLDAPAATFTAPSLAIDAPVSITGALVFTSLTAGASETAGITAGTLRGVGTLGTLALTAANSIATLGSLHLSATSSLDLVDTGSLDITGSLTGQSATLSAATIGIDAPVSLTALTLAGLTGGVTQSAALTLGTLAGASALGGTIALNNASNQIGTLGNLTIGGDLVLESAQLVTMPGVLDVGGNVTFGGAGVTETSTGTLIAQTVSTAGAVTGNLILGDFGYLTAPLNNTIAALGNVTAGGTLRIDDPGETLSINNSNTAAAIILESPSITGTGTLITSGTGANGPLDLFAFFISPAIIINDLLGSIVEDNAAPAPYTLTTVSLVNVTGSTIEVGGSNSSEFTIAGTGNLNYGSLTVELVTTGSIADNSGTLLAANLELDATGFTQAAGAVLDVGTLSGFGIAETAILLTNQANSIAALGSLSLAAAGTLSVFDATALTIAAPIDPASVTLASLGSLAIDAGINASANVLLSGGGEIIENGASINTPTLSSLGSIEGDIQLLGAGNTIGSLGTFSATSLELTEAGALTIAGPVSLTSATLSVGTLAIPGSLTATTLTLENLTGGATEAGALSVTTLSSLGTLTGALALTGANSVSTLGIFAADQLTLLDTGSLDIASALTGGNVTLGVPTLGLNAAVSLTGALILESLTGDLTQSIAVDVATFGASGALGGNILLTNAGNSIGTLGDLSLGAPATLAVTDAEALVLAGTLAAGSIDLIGPNVTQSSGSLNTANLSVGASGAVSLGGLQNTIASLSSLSGSALLLTDSRALDVTGSVTGSSLTLNVPTLALDAGVSVSGLLALGGIIGGVTQTAPLTAGTLASLGSLSGLIALGNSGDLIGTLGNFTAGTLELGDAEALAIAGNVSLANLIFETLAFGATQTSGALDLASLTAFGNSAGDLRFPDAGNAIAAFGSLTTGTLSVTDAAALTIDGNLTAAAATLSAPSLAIDAPVSLAGALILAGLAGGLTEASTIGITAATLAGTGDLTGPILLNGTNAIATLGALSVSTFALVDTGDLTIAGALTGTDATLSAASIMQAAPVSLTGALTLANLAGGYTQTSLLSVGTLTSEGNLGGTLDLGVTENTIGTLGDMSIVGDLYLADSENLLLTGTIDVGNVTFAGKGVSQTSGLLATNTLSTDGTLETNLFLGGPGTSVNTIAALGDITAKTQVSIIDLGSALYINGTVGATNVGVVAPAITGMGTLQASYNQSSTLGLLAVGTPFLGSGLHLINTLGGQSGTIDLGNSTLGSFTIAGDYSSINADGIIELGNTLTTDLTIAGSSTFGNNIAELFALGTIFDDAGVLSATALSFSAAAFTQASGASIDVASLSSFGPLATAILLDGTANTFATLGTFALATTGTLDVMDTGALTIAAPLDASVVSLSTTGSLLVDASITGGALVDLQSGGNLTIAQAIDPDFVTLSALGSIMLAADVTANTLVALQSGGPVEEGAFAISAPTLISLGSIAGDVSLGGGNSIGTLGSFTATSLELNDTQPLVLAGPVSLGSAAFTVSALDITGSLTAGSLNVTGVTGGVTETGSLFVTSLASTGVLTGGVSLTGANSIATLGAFDADQLILADTQSLDITGALTGGTATFSVPSLGFDAPVSLTGALGLTGITNGIMQTAAITVPSLSGIGALAGTLSITDPSNSIGTLGDVSLSSGTFALGDSATLVLAGQVSDAAGLISFAAPSLVETTGNIAAGRLAVSATGAVILQSNANSIASLSGLTARTLLLDDTGSLDITGPVTVASASFAVPTIGLDGAVNVAGLLTLGSLVASLTEATGTLTAGTLTTDSAATGTVVLSNPANAIGTLGNFSGSALDIGDSRPLDLAGNITLTTLALDNDAGNVSQTTGTLTVTTLTAPGSLTGNISLADAGDVISTLGLATAQTLALSQASGLTIAGPVTLAAATLGLESLAIQGSLDVAGQLLLTSLASGLTAAGAVTVGTLTSLGSLTGPIAFSNGDNSIATLGNITTSSFALLDAGGLDVTGTLNVPVLSLSSPDLVLAGDITATALALGATGGSITQTGGALNVATLLSDGAITGGLSLQAGANSIATFGAMTLGGELALTDIAPLTITGALSAGAIDLEAPSLTFVTGQFSTIDGQAILSGSSGVALDGVMTVASDLELVSPGAITEGPSATIVAQTIASDGATDGAVTLLATQNAIGTLANFTADKLQIADAAGLLVAGTVAVTNDVTLNDNISLAIDAAITALGTVALISNEITYIGGSVSAGSVIALAPGTSSVLVDIGGTSPGLSLSASLVSALTAGTIVIGQAGSFTASSIVNDAAVSFGSNLDLIATDAVMQTTLGTLGGTGISISAPGVTLGGLVDATGDLGVTSTGAISLAGTAIGQNVTLSAPAMALTGEASAASVLDVVDASGFAPAGTLFGADIMLSAPALTPSGLVAASDTLALLTTGALTDAGTLSAATLSFSAGSVTESVAGPITAGLLTGAATGGAVYLTNAANSVASLGLITVAAGAFDLETARALNVTALVSANDINLTDTAGGVSLAAAGSLIAGTGSLSIISDTLAANAGAAFVAATDMLFSPYTANRPIDLGGTEASALDLSATLLAAVSAPNLTIATAGSLLTEGGVSLGPVATLLLSAAGIEIDGSLAMPGSVTGGATPITTALIELASTQPVTEAATAAITAGTLATDGSLATDILLTSSLNSVGTLGGVTLGGADSFALGDAGTLGLTAPLIAGVANLFAGSTLGLSQTGTILTAEGLTLAAPSIALGGLVDAGSLLALNGATTVSEFTGATVSATTLAGNDPGGSLILTAASNSFADIGSLAAASLTFDDSTPLTIAGSLSLATATLTASAVNLAGDADISGLLLFPSLTAGLIQSAGTLTAGTLESDSADAGTVSLGDAGNAIGTLGLVTADHLLLADAGLLTVTGPLTAATATLAAGTIMLAGTLTDSTLLALDDTAGGITQLSGALAIGTLASDIADAGPVSLTQPGNSIAALGAFTMATGNLDLATAGTLTLAGATTLATALLQAASIVGAGALTGAVVMLAAPNGITLEAPLTATTALTLETYGNAAETLAGVITTPLLTTDAGTIGGNLYLGNSNSIAEIADIVLPTGTLTLNDATSLAVAGIVSAAAANLTAAALDLTGVVDIAGALSLDNNAPGGITLAGVESIGGLLSLTANGGLVETGTLTAATIAGNFTGGGVTLGGANSLATLGSLYLGANTLSIDDLVDLTITGPVSAAAVSIAAAGLAVPGSLSATGELILSAPSIGATGALSAGSTLVLDSAATVAISGYVTAGTISSGGSTLGNVALTGQNTIGALASLDATGALDVADSTGLMIAGSVTAATATIAAPAVTLASDFDAGSSLLFEDLTGGVLQTQGTLSATVLADSGANAGTINLQGTANNIGTLGTLSLTTGDLLLTDAAPTLTISGPLSVAVADISAPNLQVLGPVSASALTIANGTIVGLHASIDAGRQLDLVSDGNVRETGAGAITAATLNAAGALGGNFNLPGANTIGTLGTLSVPNGQLILADNVSLTIAGPISASTATIAAAAIDLTGTLLSASALDLVATGAGGITLSGSLAANDIMSLASAGGIDQTGGLSAAILTGSAAGPVVLDGADSVASLGAFAAPGETFTLADLTTLAINGPVSVGSATIDAAGLTLPGTLTAAGDVTLASTGGIALAGSLSAGSTLALFSSSTVSGTGAIAAATLTTNGLTDGPITLNDMQNTIASVSHLGAVSLDLIDQSALSAANVTVPVISLVAPSLGLTGDVTATTLFAAAVAGGISQSAGTLTTGLLTSDGAANGATSLTDAGNAIGTLGAYSLAAGDALALFDGTGLTVAGPLAGAAIDLSAPSLALTGIIDANTGLTLASTGDIIQTAGLIVTPTLSSGAGGIGGNLSLLEPNSIAVLGTLSDAGNIALTTVETLTFAEPVSAANVSLAAAGLDLNAPFTTGVLQISTTGPVSETGALTVATLTTGTGSIAGALVLNADNDIADLGTFAATGGLVLNDISGLTINGPINLGGALALNAAGITQTAGTINAPALTSDGATIAGSVRLSESGNVIPTLGNFAAAGTITLADASALTLEGNLANGDGTISLTDAASLSQTAGAITTGVLNAAGTAILLPDANVIAALGTVATAGALNIDGVSATTGQLNADSATITSPGAFALGGTNSVTGALDVTAQGVLSQTGGSLIASSATLAAGAISLTGTDHIAGDLSITTAGDITHTAGILDAGTLTGTAGQLASFAATTDFGTIGSFIMADSAFDLVNTGALSLDGPLVANTVSLSASGVLTLVGSVVGGLYVTGAPAATTVTAPRAGLDSVLTGASIQEIGSFYINSGAGAALYNTQAALGSADQTAAIFLLTVTSPTQAGGPIALSTSGLGIDAPNADIIVDAGTAGSMTGNLNALHLEVLGGLNSEFTGTIDGFTGQTAAGKAGTFPVALSRYQFNACPIGSVDCQIINIAAVPATNPLGNFDVTQRKRRRLDKNVQLPGIATHDF